MFAASRQTQVGRIMLGSSDEALLKRALLTNKCILFLGAGFSAGAKNRRDESLPVGSELAKRMWEWVGYQAKFGTYDETPLDRLFDVARKERGDKAMKLFLEECLRVASYPGWYGHVTYPFWHRVYTVNVDDLVERVFGDARTTRLDVVNAITSRQRERDAFLEKLQYIKLNGSLSDGLDGITFGTRQYAKRSADFDPWYDQFVRDYSTHVTVLVGTKLNEPLFARAIEARGGRSGAAQELRLRSFLVADRISPVIARSLDDFNVVPVEATSEEFFTYMSTLIGAFLSREEMLVQVNPQATNYLTLARKDPKAEEAARAFASAFMKVEVQDTPKHVRSLYLHGATPDWKDIAAGLDATRDVTAESQARFATALDSSVADRFFAVTDHRGAGKSTLLMRTAMNLAAAGYAVFFGVGEDAPEPHLIARALDLMDRTVALFIDDAEWVTGRARLLVEQLSKLKHPPVLVLAVRSNLLHNLEDAPYTEIWLGELTDADIEAIIDVLERTNTLGVMTDQPRTRIRPAFKLRARKQLLVAMKEVTTGRDFDDIIKREYNDIVDPELRLTYLIACLATAAGASLTRRQLLACSELPPALLLNGLERELRNVVVRATEYGDRVIARHAVIAATVVETIAPKGALSVAYKRILSVLANDMDSKATRGEPRRWFRLFKSLINHQQIYLRFERDIDEARSIFDTLTAKLTTDPHYWLQYGSLELEFGELDFATRYINTAESIAPNQFLIRNAKGHLLLALGRSASSLREAEAYRMQGEDVLNEAIEERGDESDYPWHILIAHILEWIETWVPDRDLKRKELNALRLRAAEACEANPRSHALEQIRDKVERAYLLIATKP
jgi:hypothetical protein